MKSLKKIIAVLAIAALSIISLAACGKEKTAAPQDSSSDEIKIGIIQYESHPSLDNCYNGIAAALAEAENSDKFTIERQVGSDASADNDCATYAKNMVAEKYDVIIAIATPAAASAFAATEGTDIPVIFCAVSDPVKAELVQSLDAPGDNCTGTSDVLDLNAQVDLIEAMQPDVKTIGILYTTSEANSISNLEVFKKIAAERGLEVEASGVQNASDIPSAAAALCSKVDCINNFTDNNVVNNLSILLEAAGNVNIPVYGSEIEQVKNGCLAAVSIDYVALGKVTGQMALDVLGGESAATMAVKSITDATPVVNTEVLAALGMTMPQSYTSAETVETTK